MPKEFQDEPLESALELELAGIVKRSCAYALAKNGIIPSYLVGPKQGGVRFRRSEVLASLRRGTQPQRDRG